MKRADLIAMLEKLVLAHSPCDRQEEVDVMVTEEFQRRCSEVWKDEAGNIIALIKGGHSSAPPIAVTSHRDEIGMIVRRIEEGGRIWLKGMEGSSALAWVYGEGPVDLLGDHEVVTGIASFGLRHAAKLNRVGEVAVGGTYGWDAAWVETKLSPQELTAKGIHVGCRAVIGRHRKRPLILGDYIAGYGLDGKAGLPILFDLAHTFRQRPPAQDTYLIATANEERGCLGAMHTCRTLPCQTLIALEVGPVAAEYQTTNCERPILIYDDHYATYDLAINRRLTELAKGLGFEVQPTVLSGFGSDASVARRHAGLARAVGVGYPTENTHGFEICHLQGIENVSRLVAAYLIEPEPPAKSPKRARTTRRR